METVLLIFIIIYLLITNKKISSKLKELHTSIFQLDDKLRFLQQKFTSLEQLLKERNETVAHKETEQEVREEPVISKEKVIIEEVQSEFIASKEIEKEEPIVITAPRISTILDDQKLKTIVKEVKKQVEFIPKKSWIENFKEKNPDLEKFIGENLINKIGVLILVLGISFFVKFAIDKEWINEPARVGIGVLCGSLIMMIAHKLKKNYASFSSVLVAGAISVFYFTIYIAFHEYQLFSQTVAFSIMAIITAFSTLVSVSYNRQELAVLSLIGGFAAPFMVSTGEGNYAVLFSYIAILNLGILGVSYFKKWKIATILDFVFTSVLFVSWCLTSMQNQGFEHYGALTFATIFYFIFSITIVLHNLKNKGVFSKIEYFILIANTFIFFGIGMIVLRDVDAKYTGLFTLLLALYNVSYATILYKKFGLDKNAVYILIGLALTFVTLTIPIQFQGNQITLFWAAEVVLLFWLSQKSRIEAFKMGAIIVQILSIISLLLDWELYTTSKELSVVLNPLFIAGFVVSISLFLTYWLTKKEGNMVTKFFTLDIHFYRRILLITLVTVTYFTGFLEIKYQANQFLENSASANSFAITYHFVFVVLLFVFADKLKNKLIQKVVLLISCISIFLYITSFYKLPTDEIIQNFELSVNRNYAFYFHYIILMCLIYFGFQLFSKTSAVFKVKPAQSKWLPWIFVFAIVYIVSNEIMVHGIHFSDVIANVALQDGQNSEFLNYKYIDDKIDTIQAQIIKIGYPILWGVFSFIFLIIGIKKQWKNLRIIALSLLGVTIVKLFVYDIKNVSETGKIIAFILLGVLILIISFVYQKIKKLVNDETSENEKI
ncbi:DUF2339 domain-containing protein [Polaribacter glomeratus]|uniref:Beta-carotene 15,15'-monooxygenase n=1 Tax=Polaribacter glomeratus TaxID=102 RepID=A0A2S7WGM7_9FLAO|nr:DUF2339 domain-containing protein [Polaribacter glomeratus]PQJ76461.1 hypothetical protein BTO16_11155 [Polaribacter glomeratus]TXD65595.1 DUF2339 domain-containing protein [Polaribacter glomeratus]